MFKKRQNIISISLHVRSKAYKLHDCHDDWCARIWARKIHAAAPQELIFPFKLCGGSVAPLGAAP